MGANGHCAISDDETVAAVNPELKTDKQSYR